MPDAGVITEQGFVAGKFGFSPISESDQKKMTTEEKDKRPEDKK